MHSHSESGLSGGCYCGKIRYELAREPKRIVVCHCANCRRISGGTTVSWILFQKADFQYSRGTPKTYLSDTGATWSFCDQCGTTLTYEGKDYEANIDISLVTLDDHLDFAPSRDANVKERLPWLPLISTEE